MIISFPSAKFIWILKVTSYTPTPRDVEELYFYSLNDNTIIIQGFPEQNQISPLVQKGPVKGLMMVSVK